MHTTLGHAIKLHGSGIDVRDYLDAKAMYTGDQLLLWADGGWIVVRYEVADVHERAVVLDSVDAVRRLDRGTMRFRWPMKEE